MGYVKQTWVDKETPLDAAHMNHIEEGLDAAHKAIEENSQVATDDEIVEALLGMGALPAITDENGAILTDENNAILMI